MLSKWQRSHGVVEITQERNIRAKSVPFLFTALPRNFHEWLPHLSGLEVKLYAAIARMTWGYGKHRDAISLDQLVQATSGSRRGVINAISSLENHGLLKVKRAHRRLSIYEITAIRWVSKTAPKDPI